MDEILRKLVSYPTVTGDEYAMHQLLDYVAEFVTQRGMHVEWFESGGFESIVATTRPGQKTPKVMLAAHADVVPADTTMFTMQEGDGKYIGRGVLDMKFAIAAYLQIVDDLKDRLEDYDFGIQITADEEIGGAHGTAKLIDEGYLPQVCIIPDGGENWQVQTASKGSCVFEITATGKTAHGSRPWLGDNALIKLISVLDEIATLFPRHPSPDTNTITLGKMEGGEAANQVPGLAMMAIDVRTVNSQEYQRVSEEIQAICRRRGIDCRLAVDIVPTQFNLEDLYIAPYVKLITEITGVNVAGSRTNGSSDARWYVPYGVPCISLYPTGSDLHSDGEWIDIKAFEQFQAVTAQYLETVAKVTAMPTESDADGPILTAAV
jgi:succinyl-diaminopimelate desuccinylase